MIARSLLDSAHQIMSRSDIGLEGVWPRAAALLGRQALEESLDAFWERTLPGMREATYATRLACLPQYLRDKAVADGVKVAWSALSRACHHHPYELSPTADELSRWLEQVDGLIELLDETAS
jgi:hypothetical protein